MEAKKYLLAVGASLACTAFGAYLYSRYEASRPQPVSMVAPSAPVQSVLSLSAAPSDFTEAAEKTVNGVVHVKVSQNAYGSQGYSDEDSFFDFFFGPGYRQQQRQQQPVTGSGSGVVVSSDGYVVTNNHVIDGADKIEVVLNDKRSFEARLIGTDPTTDIALIKIEADGLKPLSFANSDDVKVGEWVLAVGNPFNLTSTVTAGIVSAKSRHVGINTSNMAIESFIQTDAAVNPGNSGGALVNTRGEVVGINTAIASTTGSYSGYSFAVPSNIAQKVAQDLKQYGEVQRALLGVSIAEVSSEVQQRLGLSKPEGVLVAAVADGGAAREAGLEVDDVITSVDGEAVNSVPDLQAKVAQHRPGDVVSVSALRNGKNQKFSVTLRNIRGTTSVVKGNGDEVLGAKLEKVSDSEAQKIGIRYGLRVAKLGSGKLKDSGVKEGFIITKANRQPVTTVQDFQRVVASTSDGLLIAGVYPDGRVAYYAVNLQE